MKATRKLIPALALLLVSAVLLSTASYAWFTTNSAVDANMTVSVSAPNTLLISETENGTYGTSVTFAPATSGIYPCSTTDGIKFYHIGTSTAKLDGTIKYGTQAEFEAAVADDTAVIGDTFIATTGKVLRYDAAATADDEAVFTEIGTVTEVSTKAEYLYEKSFWIQSPNATEADQLQVKVDIAEGAIKGATGALRVAVIIGSEIHLFSENDASTLALNATGAANTTYIIEGGVGLIKTTLASADPQEIKVIIWYEGNDGQCISTNVQQGNTSDVKVTIEYNPLFS